MKNIGKPIFLLTGILLCGFAFSQNSVEKNQDRPNILWITCEDISPYLGCYGCPEAQTPNLDRLAEMGIRYTQAYANAPVCAVARSTILSGMHATTLGTHQMRSQMLLPSSIPAYPRNLRKAGYYCTNNSKKDYNSNLNADESLWDESSKEAHWMNRKEDQPFFAIFNLTETHESQLSDSRIQGYKDRNQIPDTPRIDPEAISLPPYHPDLSEIRIDWARLHDLITHMDQLVGDRLRELEEAGEAENTIVFFYSDHGGMLSRAKRYIYNVGTQVPLIVHFPEKWQHLAPSKPHSTSDRLVSFVDFAKTLLSLADVEIPKKMQGRIFLGPQAEPGPSTVHFYRDRMVEYYDFSRAVTDGRYYYIHNFMPHRPRGRDARYGFQVQANWGAWQKHFDAGMCDSIQSQFFQPKPVVEFFDTWEDPWHVKNLSELPEYQGHMEILAKDLDEWMIRTRDMGIIPEPMYTQLAGPEEEHKYMYDFARSEKYPVAELLPIARSASWGDPSRMNEYLEYLQHENPVARYYGAYALFLLGSNETSIQKMLREVMLKDHMAANRIMAAQALALCGDPDAAYTALHREALAAEDGYVLILALNGFRYGLLEDRLTLEHWERFNEMKMPVGSHCDPTGCQYARRMITDALSIYPERRVAY
jgi:arylsulfatase A-like enzyme